MSLNKDDTSLTTKNLLFDERTGMIMLKQKRQNIEFFSYISENLAVCVCEAVFKLKLD